MNARAAGAAAGRAALEIRPVRSRSDLARFIDLPWRIYADDPVWVPPLRMDVRHLLDRGKHPFHQHADVECFLALRDGRVVGRIAAVVNHLYNEFHDTRQGAFGLFECDDDVDIARALLATVEEWLTARGMASVHGPMNLSTNDELYSPGVLVDGHQHPPAVMMAHTPPYYARLLETAGYAGEKDLLAYWADGRNTPERLLRVMERMKRAANIEIRPLDMKHLDREIAAIQQVYNSAWERNWGFVPMTEAEIAHMAKALRPVVNPRLCPLAFVDGEAVGFALALPDFNQALRHVRNGRLLPFGLVRLLWHRRRIDSIRVLTLGLKPAYRQRGLDAALIGHIFQEAARAGSPQGECSWILDDNHEMKNGIERIGGGVYKTYRVYGRELK